VKPNPKSLRDKELTNAKRFFIFYGGLVMVESKKPVADTFEILVQVNGKARVRVKISADADKTEMLAMAKEAVANTIEGKSIIKEVVVPRVLINLIVK